MDGEQVKEHVSNAVTAIVLKGTSRVPFVKPDADDVVRKVNKITDGQFNIFSPPDFFGAEVPIAALDRAAKDYTRNAQLFVTTSGAGTGLAGLVGIAPNVGLLVSATVGLVRRHALVYGFTDIEDDQDNKMPLLIGFAAALGAQAAINQASAFVGGFAAGVAMNVAARHAAQMVLARQVSYYMAVQMVAQTGARVLPVVSGVTSGALNYVFLRSAGRRSATYWRERHIIVRQSRLTNA